MKIYHKSRFILYINLYLKITKVIYEYTQNSMYILSVEILNTIK